MLIIHKVRFSMNLSIYSHDPVVWKQPVMVHLPVVWKQPVMVHLPVVWKQPVVIHLPVVWKQPIMKELSGKSIEWMSGKWNTKAYSGSTRLVKIGQNVHQSIHCFTSVIYTCLSFNHIFIYPLFIYLFLTFPFFHHFPPTQMRLVIFFLCWIFSNSYQKLKNCRIILHHSLHQFSPIYHSSGQKPQHH